MHAQKAKFSRDVLGLTMTQQSWLFLFAFSPPVFWFSFAGHLVGALHSVGRVFGKALRILGLDVRNGMWAVEQDFHRDFRVNVKWFFAFFSGLLDWADQLFKVIDLLATDKSRCFAAQPRPIIVNYCFIDCLVLVRNFFTFALKVQGTQIMNSIFL